MSASVSRPKFPSVRDRKKAEWIRENHLKHICKYAGSRNGLQSAGNDGRKGPFIEQVLAEHPEILEGVFPSVLPMPPWKGPLYDKDKPTHIFDLLPHLRYKIFDKLSTEHRVKAQLVCRQFRDEIRIRNGIGAYVDHDTVWGVSFMRDIIYETIVVGPYEQPKKRPRELILRWHDVKHLLFRGPISMPYVDAFLARCRGVKRVSFHCDLSERAPIPRDLAMRRDYKSWRKIETIREYPIDLWNCKVLEIKPKGRFGHNSIRWALQIGRYSTIDVLKISTQWIHSIGEIRQIHEAVFSFIEKHPHIKEVWVGARVGKYLKKNGKPTYLKPERIVRAVSGRAQLRALTLLEENVDFEIWGTFLQMQEKLEVMQVMHNLLYPVLHTSIINNRMSLRKIALHVTLDYMYVEQSKNTAHLQGRYLDLSVFQTCKVLKELYISVCHSKKRKDDGFYDLNNFKYLPVSLQALAIRNATFRGEDIGELKNHENLKTLGLCYFCPAGAIKSSFVLSLPILNTLLTLRSLDEFLLQGTATTLYDVSHVMREIAVNLKLVGCSRFVLHIKDPEVGGSDRWIPVGSGLKKRLNYNFSGEDLHIV